MAGSVGTIFAELDLDNSRYLKSQKKLYQDATQTTLNIEANFKKLGIKSSAEMDLMRQKITNSYNMIANSSKATANDILRAEKAKNAQLKRLNEEQYGAHQSMLSKMKSNWVGLTVGITAAYMAISRITRAAQEWARMAGEQQKAEAGLLQAMKSMGRYSPEFYEQMLKTASALQQVTTFGDEATIAGQKFLMTYKQIPDELMPRVTATMLDLAALMGGDTKQAANMLGKAAMGLGGELRKVGITIDPLIAKSGDFAAILSEIESQVKGQARAIADTGIGPWEQLSNLWGDSKEKLGELVLVMTRNLLPALRSASTWVGELAEKWTKFLSGPTSSDVLKKQSEGIRAQIEDIKATLNVGMEWGVVIGDDYKEKLENQLVQLKKQLQIVEQTIRNEEAGLYNRKVIKLTPPPSVKGEEGISLKSQYEGFAPFAPDPSLMGASEPFEAMKSLTEEFDRIEQDRLKIVQNFNEEYDRLGKSQFDIERENLARQKELWMAAGVDKTRISQMYSDQAKKITKEETLYAIGMASQMAGAVANTFLQISQAGGKSSKEAFRIYQGMAMAQAIMNTATLALAGGASLAALPIIGPALAAAWVPTAYAMGAIQIAMIASAKPPSYDEGGISRAGGVYQTGNIDEAHIPLKGGKVPVNVNGGGQTVVIKMENPVFQDVATQRQVFAQIAEVIARKVAPGAVVQNYKDDGQVRAMVRGRV